MVTKKILKGAILAATVMTVGHAYAEHVNPAGTFTESKLQGAKPSGPTTVTGQVKQWVGEKMTSLSSIWSGSAPAPQTVRQPASEQPTATASAIGDQQPREQQTATGDSQQSAAGSQPQSYVPSATVGSKLAAPVSGPKQEEERSMDLPGLKRAETGVQVYDLGSSPKIPRLRLDREEKLSASRFGLDTRMQKMMDDKIIAAFPSPDVLTDKGFKTLAKFAIGKVEKAKNVKDVVFSPKGRVKREAFDRIAINLKAENVIQLAKFKELTVEEVRFLSGLLLYQQGEKCASAVGLFHKLSKTKAFESEADYYLAMCSRKLGLTTDFYERTTRVLEAQDIHYTRKLLKEISEDELPYEFTDRFGLALFKVSGNPKVMDKLDEKTTANVAYILAQFGAGTDRYKTALEWSRKVPKSHPKYLQSRFVEALALYQNGQKDKAMKLQEQLINDLAVDSSKMEFQALVALNAARMYFQEMKFKDAHKAFMRVYKDHPLWLQSLTELGWSQLQSGDYEGAIGNMYSIQSPFFANVYKPESFVIRTVGYLNLCQFGDAYKTLSILEHDYRPILQKVERYSSAKPTYYQTVRNFMQAPKGTKEVDGLPTPVVREMARHRDFTNLQKALNRQLDERALYAKFDGDVDKSLKRAQALVSGSRFRSTELRKKIASIKKNSDLEGRRLEWQSALDKELDDLNGFFFQVDLYQEAKAALPEYRKDVVGGADKRMAKMRGEIEHVLASRVLRMKTDLARILDNNELLRYEVFAGSGENIRFQVAGGETGKRVPASVIPKSKALQWDFDGEYWEDEIGSYRSTLKNNCPDNVQVNHAALEGEVE
ncbi:MAG: hypothetical protein V4760_10195 [Bdellovibrionota bacterium]